MRGEMTWVIILAVIVASVAPSGALARRYGGGGGSRSSGSRSLGSSRSLTPSAPRYDESARRAISRETSRQSFNQYRGLPAVSPQQLSTYDQRERTFTASHPPTGYYTPRPGPMVVYNDPFNGSMLQYMSMMWLFNHWNQVDHQRFDEARLRDLERQVAEMKAKGLQPDSNYVEPGVDPDLVYRQDLLGQPGGGHWGFGLLLFGVAGFALLFVFSRWSSRKSEMPRIPHPQAEDDLYNPFKLRAGDFVSFKTPDMAGRNWSVAQVVEYQRIAGDERFPMINYEIQDGDRRAILRAVPGAEANAPPEILILKVFDEMGFSQDVAEAVKSNEFYVDEDDGARITYHPLSDCGEAGWPAKTRTVSGGAQPVREGEVRYWDYFRKGDISRGEMAEDIFFFVEIDQETGWVRMLEGSRITSGDVETFPA